MAAGRGHRRSAGHGGPGDAAERDVVLGLLAAARHRLDLDLCCLSRASGDVQVVQELDGDGAEFGLAPGLIIDFSTVGPCMRVPVGPDKRADTRTDGDAYGMLCCLSRGRDVTVMREPEDRFVSLLAEALSYVVSDRHSLDLEAEYDQDTVRRRISRLIEGGGPHVVFQPVFDLPSLDCRGAEALSRFPAEFGNPERCFADAVVVGLGTALEISAIEAALRALPDLPGEFGLGVNASPATILSGRVEGTIADLPADRIVLEITEHERIDDWPSMHAALAGMRDDGVRIAMDDVGVGYAGLQQLLQLLPDFVKMDQSLVRGIDADPARRALATALVQFAEETDGLVLAEGVETAAELGVLVGTGVHQAQGRYLAPPGPLPLPASADRVARAG